MIDWIPCLRSRLFIISVDSLLLGNPGADPLLQDLLLLNYLVYFRVILFLDCLNLFFAADLFVYSGGLLLIGLSCRVVVKTYLDWLCG